MPPHICFLDPNLGVGVRFPVRAGQGWPGLKDMGTRARATGPTRGQERTQAVSGVGGHTGPPVGLRSLDQSRGRGRRGVPCSWIVCLAPDQLCFQGRVSLAPTRRQPFTVLGASEDFPARPSSRPLPHRGGARPERGREGSAAVGRAAGPGPGPKRAAGLGRPVVWRGRGSGALRAEGGRGAGPVEVRPLTLLPCPLPGEGQPPGWRKRTRPWPSSSR